MDPVGAQVLSGRFLDASTTQPEDKWYVASDDWQRLNHYCSMWRGARRFDCVDALSHSQRFASGFARAGFMAVAYDIMMLPDWFHDAARIRAGEPWC